MTSNTADPGRGYDQKQKAAHKRRRKENISALKSEAVIGENGKRKISLSLPQIGIIGGVVVVLLITLWAITPRKGSTGFALCRVFLELNVRFPNDLRYAEVVDFGSSIRIWYVRTDGFGAERMEPIQCYHANGNPESGAFERISINRRDVDPEQVRLFNASIPAILEQGLDRTMPDRLPNTLRRLRADPGRNRMPIFGGR